MLHILVQSTLYWEIASLKKWWRIYTVLSLWEKDDSEIARRKTKKKKITKNKKLINMTNTQWHPTPVLLPGKSHGQRSLGGCSSWGREESDPTEQLHFHFSLSCIGKGNGNPVQCSCLENPRDGGAWWVPVYGVAQSQIWLKQQQQHHAKCAKHFNNSGSCYCWEKNTKTDFVIMVWMLKQNSNYVYYILHKEGRQFP